MRRLQQYQHVALELDYESDLIDCQVLAVSGAVAALHSTSEIARHIARKLTTGSLCYLTFSHAGTPVALRGVVRLMPSAPALEFVVIDGVQLHERRADVRRAIVTRVRLAGGEDGADRDGNGDGNRVDNGDSDRVGNGDGDGRAIETATVDVSLGGARLQRVDAMGEEQEWQLELFPPGAPDAVRARARVVHASVAHLGVEFVEISASDRSRLAEMLAEHERRGGPAA